jgi:hypothetical protein
MGLAVANLALAAYMTGVIWVVQVVLYPLFARVGTAEWRGFHAAHSRRIAPVVAPPMLAHAAVAVALLVERPGVLTGANLALAGGLLGMTATVFVRAHSCLRQARVARLLRLNALRVAAWTASLGVAVALAL